MHQPKGSVLAPSSCVGACMSICCVTQNTSHRCLPGSLGRIPMSWSSTPHYAPSSPTLEGQHNPPRPGRNAASSPEHVVRLCPASRCTFLEALLLGPAEPTPLPAATQDKLGTCLPLLRHVPRSTRGRAVPRRTGTRTPPHDAHSPQRTRPRYTTVCKSPSRREPVTAGRRRHGQGSRTCRIALRQVARGTAPRPSLSRRARRISATGCGPKDACGATPDPGHAARRAGSRTRCAVGRAHPGGGSWDRACGPGSPPLPRA
ncbi:hypothetical protein C8Q77DRAFT_248213 [Trametes polyzona]|nr:hypothetical protein C8Q77DRAFT_248213 [Trametes polyzona]